MLSLLEAAQPYLPFFKGIRVSTRPDAVSPEILSFLKRYGVTAVELGAQSMSDEVLLKNGRGHTADDVRAASALISSYDMELGLQMMTGLFGSDDETDLFTARAFLTLSPATVRIYPTVVMKNTRLADDYLRGDYVPPSLESAVSLCARLLTLFEENGVRVIRMGLHHTPSLESDMLAGPYHPAFRELVESRMYLHMLEDRLHEKEKGAYAVRVHPRCVSALIGQKRGNIEFFRLRGYRLTVIQDDAVSRRTIRLSSLS